MSKHERDEDGEALPKPIALTPDQVHQVAAGAATALLPGTGTGKPAMNGPPIPSPKTAAW
jgi:hypothetical protein